MLILISPLYSMNPRSRNLFMKKLTLERVVPITLEDVGPHEARGTRAARVLGGSRPRVIFSCVCDSGVMERANGPARLVISSGGRIDVFSLEQRVENALPRLHG